MRRDTPERYNPTNEDIRRGIPTPNRYTRDRDYRLRDRSRDVFSPEEIRTLRTIGAFRCIDARYLPERDIQALRRDGAIERNSIVSRDGERINIVALTPRGLREVDEHRFAGDLQRFHCRLVKPAEAEHDCAIYPAYERERQQIEAAGGTVNRVVLDVEFRSQINRDARQMDREQLAEKYKLPVVDNVLKIPDARVEYRDAQGQERHLDIEVASRGKSASGNAQTGFRMHSRNGISGGSNGGRRALDHRVRPIL